MGVRVRFWTGLWLIIALLLLSASTRRRAIGTPGDPYDPSQRHGPATGFIISFDPAKATAGITARSTSVQPLSEVMIPVWRYKRASNFGCIITTLKLSTLSASVPSQTVSILLGRFKTGDTIMFERLTDADYSLNIRVVSTTGSVLFEQNQGWSGSFAPTNDLRTQIDCSD